jgi:hypothetical protein
MMRCIALLAGAITLAACGSAQAREPAAAPAPTRAHVHLVYDGPGVLVGDERGTVQADGTLDLVAGTSEVDLAVGGPGAVHERYANGVLSMRLPASAMPNGAHDPGNTVTLSDPAALAQLAPSAVLDGASAAVALVALAGDARGSHAVDLAHTSAAVPSSFAQAVRAFATQVVGSSVRLDIRVDAGTDPVEHVTANVSTRAGPAAITLTLSDYS